MRNFRAFSDSGEIELAPLTVLTGTNSSGKSTLIRALMALRQTIESRDPSAAFVPTGTYVDLGPYEDFVFMHDIKASVCFDIKCTVPLIGTSLVGLPVTQPSRDTPITISIELAYIRSTDRIYLARSTVKIDSGSLEIRKATKGGKAIGKSYKTTVDGLLEDPISLADSSTAKFSATPPFIMPSPRSFSYKGNQNKFFATQMSKQLEDSIVQEFSSLRYIGPLRERPKRMYISTGEAPREVGSAGELGPAVLWSASEIVQLKLEDQLSHWCNRMGLAFEIELLTIYGSYFEVNVVDSHTRAHINLPDVGIGTSQILPILIQGLIAIPGNMLLLEQPEIHLHPRVQADLADFLLEVSSKGSTVVVETHSEHFITRLQRRVAEGTLRTEDVAIYYVIPTPEGSQITRVRLDQFGQIESAPEGFFEEGFEETFALMRAVGDRKAVLDS